MRVELRQTPLDPWAEVAAFERAAGLDRGACGAATVFVGTMRDMNEGEAVTGMELVHYPGMTERELERLASEACERWPVADVLVIHRIGEVAPGDTLVVVAAWSAHRAAAFEACRFLIEALKSRAPLWKKEHLPGGSRWVARNTPGELPAEVDE